MPSLAELLDDSVIPDYADIIYEITSFKGGMNTKAGKVFIGRDTQFALRKDQCTLLHNLDRTESGVATTRMGTEKFHQTAITPSFGTQQVRSLFEYRQRSGSTYILCNVGNGVYVWDPDNNEWDLVYTLPIANERVLWCQFNDVAIGVSPSNTPFQFNGASAQILTGTPPSGGTAIAAYRGHVYIAKSNLSLAFCALDNQNDWTSSNDAGTVPVPTIGGRTCLGLFPFYNRMIVATDTEIFSMLGTSTTVGSADFFRFELNNTEYGHEGAANSIFAAGNTLVYFDKKGVHHLEVTDSQSQLGDLRENYASAVIEPDWLYLDNNNMPNRTGFNIQSKSMYAVMGSNNSLSNQIAYVADYYHKDPWGNPTWSMYYPFAYACGIETKRFGGRRTVLLGGYDGFVYKMTNAVTDNGTAIFTRLQIVTDCEQPAIEKLWRYCIPYISPPNALQGVQRFLGNDWTLGTDPLGDLSPFLLRCNYDFGRDVFQQTVGIGLPSGTETMGTDWAVAFSALGSADIITPRVSITGTGRRLEVTMEYNGAYRIGIAGLLFLGSSRRVVQ